MIVQSPESEMPEPYKTYVPMRNQTIATVLGDVVGEANIQLCPRAITPDEQIFREEDSIVYGAVVKNLADGYKSVLYSSRLNVGKYEGIATLKPEKALKYAVSQLQAGNRVRVKDPEESDGQGQHTVETIDEMMEAFNKIVSNKDYGVVLMPHLDQIIHRISVGRIVLGRNSIFHYFGREQTVTKDGHEVYGGTDIGLFGLRTLIRRSEIEEHFDIPQSLTKLGLDALDNYSYVAQNLGRVSVDIIEGITDNGTRLQEIVDITPRVGGVTPAEVLAIRALHQEQATICMASSRLIYEPTKLPKNGVNFIETDSLVINADVSEVS